MTKETIYIDVEDDITAVIDKITSAKDKIVALVPPKRANVFTSVVNLKLVQKTAQDANKRVVLITTDKNLVALAGGVGIYVAPNLNSAPAIPAAPPPPEDMPSEVIEDGDAPVVAKGSSFSLKKADRSVATPARDRDMAALAAGAALIDDKPEEATGDPKTNRKLAKAFKIPDFGMFKKRMILIILAVLLVVGGSIWAFYLAPSAKVAISGQTNRIATETPFTVDTKLTEANFADKELPATSKELRREGSETATPTGQKNIGQKASGTVTLQNCEHHNGAVQLPSGTTLTANGLNFLTTAAVTLPASSFSGGGICQTSNKEVNVTAQEAGDKYNLSPRSYTTSGHPDIKGTGSAMGGGTNEVVTILTQADIDKARDAAESKLREGAKEELIDQFSSGIFVLDPSFAEIESEVISSVPANERADTASVKVAITFFALGVDRQILEDFLKDVQKASLQPNQAIFNSGLDTANITKTDAPAANRQVFQLKTDAFAGPAVDLGILARELAGKGFGESKRLLEALPGVTEANIDLSPFWVFSMPRQADHIHIEIKVTD